VEKGFREFVPDGTDPRSPFDGVAVAIVDAQASVPKRDSVTDNTREPRQSHSRL